MKTLNLNLLAGVPLTLDLIGNYFHLLETTSGVDIEFMRGGAVVSTSLNMEFGFFAKPSDGFTQLSFTSAANQPVKIAVGIGDGGYNRMTGTVQILESRGVYTQSQKTVTSASAELLAANLLRNVAVIQNNDASGSVYVTLDGTAATVAKGLKIAPGGVLVLDKFPPVAAINAIGSIASNANVVVAEA